MKKIQFLSLFVLCALFSLVSCSEDETIPTSSGDVNFFDMKVGQKSVYRAYAVDYEFIPTGGIEIDSCYYKIENLTIEVISGDAGNFTIKESLSTQNDADAIEYLVNATGNQVLVTQISGPERLGPTLFYQKLFRIAPLTAPLVELDDSCFGISGFQVPQNEFAVTSATISGKIYQNLFGYTYDEQVPTDGPLFVHLFSENGAMVRSQLNGTFLPSINGWELISH